MTNALPPLVAIMGPTSSGKTATALRVARALHGEVVNADARQLYHGAPIGTAIPKGAYEHVDGERVYTVEGIPHHLLGVCDPAEPWSVAAWLAQARSVIERIHARGCVPVVVGGTGLYVRALTEGFVFDAAPPDPAIRARVLAMSFDEQRSWLTNEGVEIDEQTRMNPYRVQRMVERLLTGPSNKTGQQLPSWDVCKVGILRSSDEQRARIAEAVRTQLEGGWIEEVQALMQQGVDAHAPLLTIIGFRSIVSWLQQKERTSLKELEETIVHETWQYARRQRTWIRHEPRCTLVQDEQEATQYVEAWAQSRGILSA